MDARDAPWGPRPVEVARELAVADEALAGGDKKHAARHAAAALALDPDDERALAFVDKLLDEKPGFVSRLLNKAPPLAPLFPDDGWYGHVAVRARALYKRGDLGGALSHVAQLAVAVPHVRYHGWLADIVDDAARAGDALDPSFVFTAFSTLGGPFIGLLHLRAGERAFFAPWADACLRLLSTHVDAETAYAPVLALVTSGFCRRAGRYEDAAKTARLGLELGAGENAGIQLGLALRAQGAFDDSAALFLELAMAHDDVRHRMEAARARYDQGRFDEALALFEEGDARDPEIALARAACRRAAGARDVDADEGRVGVATLDVLFPDGAPSFDDIRRVLCGDGSEIEMRDASSNVVRSALEKLGASSSGLAGTTLSLRVTCLESPSVPVMLACALARPIAALEYAFDARPARDPSLPLADDGAALWKTGATLAEPALPPPPAAVQALVDEVAALAGHAGGPAPGLHSASPAMSVLWARARSAAVDDVDPEHLLAAMLHPPPVPPGLPPDAHVFGRQRAAALLLAAHQRQQPWPASTRRESLRRLVLGPPDWTTAAALVALTEVLLDEPDAAVDARAWLDVLAAGAPETGHCPWAAPLAHLVDRVPFVRRELKESVAEWLKPAPP